MNTGAFPVDPNHRGVMDIGFVRPAPSEWPKYAYRKSSVDPRGYQTKLLKSQTEQDALAKLSKGWVFTTTEIHALLDPIHKLRNTTTEEVEEESAPEPLPAAAGAKKGK